MSNSFWHCKYCNYENRKIYENDIYCTRCGKVTNPTKDSKMQNITKSQFNKFISEHQKFLSDPNTGKKAVFKNFQFNEDVFEEWETIDLSEAEFYDCEIHGIDISNCDIDFTKCKINDCNFDESVIKGTFTRTEILNTSFNDADLSESDIKNSTILNCKSDNLNHDEFYECEKESVKKLLQERDELKKLQIANNTASILPTGKQADQQALIATQQQQIQALTAQAQQVKNQESLPMSTSDSTNTVTKLSFFQSPSMNFIKNSIAAGVQITVGNKVSALLDGHVMKVLKAAGVPEKMLEHKIVKMLLSICTPQVLRMLVPLLPKIANSELAIKAIELACVSSAQKISDETLDYIIAVVEPIVNPFMKSLNSPALKAELKKVAAAPS